MAIEKRKERRIKVNLPIKIRYKGSQVHGEAENLSRLGCYVKIEKEIPIGIDISIILDIPVYAADTLLSGNLNCKGNIFRCNALEENESGKRYGIGIFFTEFSSQADAEKLSQYIDYLLLSENKKIQTGLSRWKDKRYLAKAANQKKTAKAKEDAFQKEVIFLLREVLSRLEELNTRLRREPPA
jgi:hypothetical protein